jgi:hypothetical protein
MSSGAQPCSGGQVLLFEACSLVTLRICTCSELAPWRVASKQKAAVKGLLPVMSC